MSASDSAHIEKILDTAPPLPMSPELWQAIVRAMGLPPQQARLAELVMRGLGDRQIAAVMGLREPTVRTYLARIFERTSSSNRMELAMRIMEIAFQTISKHSGE